MIEKIPWLERTFDFELPVAAFPLVLERLRGTPPRLEHRVEAVAPRVLVCRRGETWSIQEIIGHLIQVEELWAGRLDDFSSNESTLRPAAFEPGRVERARFNERRVNDLLSDFRALRGSLVHRLEELEGVALTRSAHHPRLNRSMRLLDLLLFAAEHDDHHLARITEILREAASDPADAPKRA